MRRAEKQEPAPVCSALCPLPSAAWAGEPSVHRPDLCTPLSPGLAPGDGVPGASPGLNGRFPSMRRLVLAAVLGALFAIPAGSSGQPPANPAKADGKVKEDKVK